MPKASAHQSATTTKLLFIGDSGSGKTSALFSLVKAGYNLRVLDLDNGLDYLVGKLRKEYPEGLESLIYETVTDEMRNVNGTMVPKTAKAWSNSMKLLTHWKVDGPDAYDLGPVSDWGSKDILVIDSLTLLSSAALRHILSLNARLGQRPHQSDWGDAQSLVESLLAMLYSDAIKCNVIIISHVAFIGNEDTGERGYPMTLGKALSPKVGRYFNAVLLAKSIGSGGAARKEIHTTSQGNIELKAASPLVAAKYPLETGLADYFKAVRST